MYTCNKIDLMLVLAFTQKMCVNIHDKVFLSRGGVPFYFQRRAISPPPGGREGTLQLAGIGLGQAPVNWPPLLHRLYTECPLFSQLYIQWPTFLLLRNRQILKNCAHL